MNILPIKESKIQIFHVDATPNEEYPLRILRAYRNNCDFMYSESSQEIDESNPLIKALNDSQRKRAEILDEAIAILEYIKLSKV
jgi:hypothetical protein